MNREVRYRRRFWWRPGHSGLRMEDARAPDIGRGSLQPCANRCTGRIRRYEPDEPVLHEARVPDAAAVGAQRQIPGFNDPPKSDSLHQHDEAQGSRGRQADWNVAYTSASMRLEIHLLKKAGD